MPNPTPKHLPHYQLSPWAKWLAKDHRFHAFAIEQETLVLVDERQRKHNLHLLSIQPGIGIESGWFWDTLLFTQKDGITLRFGGVEKAQSAMLQLSLKRHINQHIQRFYQQFAPALAQAAQEARLIFCGQRYIRRAVAERWLGNHLWLATGIKLKDCLQHLPAELHQDYLAVCPLMDDTHQQVARLNQAFIDQQNQLYKDFFDQVETNPLTEAQRKACIIDEQHNLVLAGAGTGKTSTMIGRAGYLIKAGLANPEQILMLAYARKAAEEMDERIQSKLGIENLTVKTFHSLGLRIISQVEGVVPSIDKMAEDDTLRAAFVDSQIQSLLEDERYRSRLLTYFLRFAYPYKSQFNFKSLGAYNAYILENDIRTLQGEIVKSYEECEIANFLYRQGIAYQYEANYQVNTSGPDYRIYQPDFFLPAYGIYIEHFAVNEHNQTPPFINKEDYLAGMTWKRALHAKYQTPLIETYSYLKQQGRLTAVLSEKLLTAGVQFKPLPQNELLDQLNQLGRVSEFSKLMAQILSLFKAAYLSIKQLVEKAEKHEDLERMRAAAYLFEPIYQAYQQRLRDNATIDFDDMIGRAIDYVESGRFPSPYRYLLVDEFQDISASRARLLKALMAQQAEASLFGVGDDWQSIYRFTGSDVALTKDFQAHFGDTATSVLDQTFRFNNKIGEVASRFVSQNPSQIDKQIRSLRLVEQPAVSLIKTDQDLTGMQAALDAIAGKAKPSASVLMLARFNFKRPDVAALKRRYPQLSLQFMTVHASKGKEADYVIVFGLDKGEHGFPSEKATHPLLELLLPQAEAFAHAEERRLFYVALTRARHHVYLVTNGLNPSPFIRELVDGDYAVSIDEFTGPGFQDRISNIPCPVCKTGWMVPRDSQYGSFFGCNQYSLCNHTQRACQWCGGGLKTHGRFRICENRRCDFVEPICPRCQGGMVLRKGPHGQFWGCSHYRKNTAFSCSHTEQFIDLKAAKVKSTVNAD
ncbi:UvrD-helicase domain-containing protein [Methylomonas rosea]|uniref:DNA 3'-5' helicase n=1 Tax=Methylomonas rosea TaxID=2952227 RepID=A0ABT1TSQ6_9GAMM|nr:UvrD-helicase domain-containing protein [Methylomonas sp. WSC-7]MCQ8117815.1 UvrD-helicase domain-containing protein [Methylomonas sp. WSC-7]